jgi:fatty acid synthase subunit beta
MGYVDEEDDCHGNPVLAYVQRHGTAEGTLTRLPGDGYTMNNDTGVFTTPFSNEPYPQVSGDFDPIHVNPYFSDFASLPGVITHGTWSLGNILRPLLLKDIQRESLRKSYFVSVCHLP